MFRKWNSFAVALIAACFAIVTLGAYLAVAEKQPETQMVKYLAPAATPFSDAVLRVLPEFEEESGIDVEVILVPFDQMFQKTILAAFEAWPTLSENRSRLQNVSDLQNSVVIRGYVNAFFHPIRDGSHRDRRIHRWIIHCRQGSQRGSLQSPVGLCGRQTWKQTTANHRCLHRLRNTYISNYCQVPPRGTKACALLISIHIDSGLYKRSRHWSHDLLPEHGAQHKPPYVSGIPEYCDVSFELYSCYGGGVDQNPVL